MSVSSVPCVDQDDGDLSSFHFSGHLAPAAGRAEERIQTVMAHVASDAIVLPHGNPHRHGDGRDGTEDVQQGETKALAVPLCGSTGEARAAPEGKATFRDVVAAVTDPRAPFVRVPRVHHRLRLLHHHFGRHGAF